MKVFIGSDHAGFELKEHLVKYLEENGIEVEDKGPFDLQPEDDYPNLIPDVAKEVSRDPAHALGIVLGMSGQGEALVANKFTGVRAGVYYGGPEEIVRLLKLHNNANVLSLGAKFLTKEQAEKVVNIWIETQFSGEERHKRRIEEIKMIEEEN